MGWGLYRFRIAVLGDSRRAPFFEEPLLPYGTIFANVAGCFLIGLMSGINELRDLMNTQAHAFLIIGLFGGFTTFSTFGYEIFVLSRNTQFAAALANLALQIILGLVAVWAGHALARAV